MAVASAADSGGNWRAELEHLQQGLLSVCLLVPLICGYLWFGYALMNKWPLGINTAPTLALFGALGAAHHLRRRHYRLACWVLLLGLTVFQALVAFGHPSPGSMAVGVGAILCANALLGTPQALLLAAVSWLTSSLAYSAAVSAGASTGADAVDLLLVYSVTLGMAWLAARPLKTSVEWALTGWVRAERLVHETRERRAELYRVVRSLEEATYRIERMNEELVAARREAEAARALKARFVATVSHELRGPLNLILGFSRLIALSPEQYGVPLPTPYRADVDAIYRNSQHLATLVDDVLDLSRIEAERLPLVKDCTDLEEDVVRKAVEIVRPLADRKGLDLRMELAGGLPWILADQVRLRQALLNLLTNAIRLTERGRVTVRTQRQEDSIVVSVQDTGPGIPAEDMPGLFQDFCLLRHGRAREARGSGLGLSISRQLVELHGGQIWAESEKEVGTTFSFTLPLPGLQPLPGPLSRTREAPLPQADCPTCLVVHEDPAIARLLARYLDGCRVVGVRQEKEAMILIEELHPAAILGSPEVAQRMYHRIEAAAYDVPVISCGLPGIDRGSGDEAILGYVVKPVAPDVLAAIMRQVECDGETTVLLVDDDPDAVRLLESMLLTVPRPYNLLRAYDGVQALQQMREVVPDVVFMDVVMPRLDGRETVARMRADERLRRVPVVIVSAQDGLEQGMVLETPLSVFRRQPIEMATGAKCLRTFLDLVKPHYLLDARDCAPSPGALSG